MFDSIKRMWDIFPSGQKLKIFGLLIMIIIGAFFELAGVAAITPFVNVAMDPVVIEKSSGMLFFYNLLHMESRSQFLICMALMLVAIYVIKNAYLIFLYNCQYKFTYNNQRIFETKLLTNYVNKEYMFHLQNNSSELQRNIIYDVMGFFNSVLAVLQLITEGLVCITLFLFLLYKDKTITIGVVVLMGLFLALFLFFVKKKMEKVGIESRRASAKRVQWIQQSLGGIKEVKVLGREQYFLEKYDENAKIYAEKQRYSQLATIVPRPILETLCICSLLLIVAFKLSLGVNPNYFLATLSVFAVAAFRLLPSFSRVTGYIGTISFQHAAVERVYQDIKTVEREETKQETQQSAVPDAKKDLKFDDIFVKNISFRYADSDADVLKNVVLKLPKNKSIAFIGASGAGKSTLADIMLGVLKPYEGSIYLGESDIFENKEEWHKMIGYIPQSIYLMDDSIKKNIAFGIDEDMIDERRLEEVLKEAQLYEFVQSLEHGVDTVVGESGVRLSGGQRQRIGIARALYNNPQILVLDEATAALDNDTEKAVMEAIDSLHGSKTLIIIAHRLSTIRNCDYVYEIKAQNAYPVEKKVIL